MNRRSLFSVAVLPVIVALPCLVSSCKKDEPNTQANLNGQYGYGQPGYGQPGYNQGYGQPGYSQPNQPGYQDPNQQQPPPAQPQPQDPMSQLTGMVGSLLGGVSGTATGSTGTTGGSTTSGNDVVAVGVRQNASQNAQGMNPDGQLLRLSLQQGQSTDAQINLAAGKCYTLVGASTPGVFEVEIVATMPVTNQVLGQNPAGINPMPVVWGGGNCYRSQMPIGSMPVNLHVTMKSGTGTVGIQPYAK